MTLGISTRPLGKTDIVLPKIGIGCSDMGNRNCPRPAQEAVDTVSAALDAGINYFDVAPYYGMGLAERRLGDALREIPRNSFVISTKVGRMLVGDDTLDPTAPRHGFYSPMPFRIEFDYSYDGIMRSWENSLHRMGLSRIDLLFVHDIGSYAHDEKHADYWHQLTTGGLKALTQLKDSGAIKAYGLGVNETAVCEQMLTESDIDCFLLAGRYTLLDHSGALPLLDQCARRGVSVISGGPYNSGLLAGGTKRTGSLRYDYGVAPPEILERLKKIETICEEYSVSLAAAALQFGLGHPAVLSVLPGVAGKQRIEDTLALARKTIPLGFWSALKDRALIDANAPFPL